MSLEKPIALGRTAEIFPWKEGQVLKLFHERFSEASVRYEARIARAVYAAGLPVPAVGEIIEIEGRLGLEYERVDGVSMWEVLQARPWKLSRYARLLAELHARMHSCNIEGVPSLRDRLVHKIGEAEGLSVELKEAALAALEHMPEGDRLCHGDFHPANVLLTERGPIVIDWVDTTIGNRLADVARTSLILLGASQPKNVLWSLQKMTIRWFHGIYVKRYFELSPGGKEEYRMWLPIVAAGRMSEGIRDVEWWLRSQVEAGLG